MDNPAVSKETVLDIVIECLKDIAPDETKQNVRLNEQTVFFDCQDPNYVHLDSLQLVTLIVDVEQKMADSFGVTITLADSRAMSQKNSPFRSVGSLADYAYRLTKGESL